MHLEVDNIFNIQNDLVFSILDVMKDLYSINNKFLHKNLLQCGYTLFGLIITLSLLKVQYKRMHMYERKVM